MTMINETIVSAQGAPEMVSHSPVKTVLTPREAARELLISMPTMYELCHRADFPAFRIGKKILINRQALAEWIERESGRGAV